MFEDTKLPAPTGIDHFIGALKAAAGGGWLGLTAEAVHRLLGTVYKTQADLFIEDLAERLKELEKSDLTVEDIFSNPKFYEAAFRAARAAAQTHQEEKREALRNAVINSALPNSPSDEWQQIFIGYVERLTPTQVRVLKLIAEAAGGDEERPLILLVQEHPELAADTGLVLQACQDLEAFGLLTKPTAGRWDYLDVRVRLLKVTANGLSFLKYIGTPIL